MRLMALEIVGLARAEYLPLVADGHLDLPLENDAAFLAFMASVDNVPVSLFLSSARTDMLPIRMWGMMESTLDVRVAAVSGTLIMVAFVLIPAEPVQAGS